GIVLEIAIDVCKFVEHALEDVAIKFVGASKRIEPVGKNPAAQRQGYFMPVVVGQNPAEAPGEAMCDAARPSHDQPDSQRRGQSPERSPGETREIAAHFVKQVVTRF